MEDLDRCTHEHETLHRSVTPFADPCRRLPSLPHCLTQALVDKNINTFSMKSGLTLGDFGWGSKTFAKMGREKIRLVALFLELGAQVVIADVDVLWLRNPLPFFQRYPEVRRTAGVGVVGVWTGVWGTGTVYQTQACCGCATRCHTSSDIQRCASACGVCDCWCGGVHRRC